MIHQNSAGKIGLRFAETFEANKNENKSSLRMLQ